MICESQDVTLRTVSDRIFARSVAGSCIAHESPSAWTGRAVKPRSRKAVREAQGLTARTSPKPSSPGIGVRLALTLSV